MVYIPKEKVLVEADDFTPPAANGPPPAPRAVNFTKNLNANIERLKLDVVTIAPLHGFVVPVAELKKTGRDHIRYVVRARLKPACEAPLLKSH